MFPRDMVCPRNMSVDTLHKGDTEDYYYYYYYTIKWAGHVTRIDIREHKNLRQNINGTDNLT
jgi:hypothetical protein